MVQYQVRYKKGIAIEMRKRGFSYSEIGGRLGLPKSTLSLWLKKIPLDEVASKKLSDRRIEALRRASKARIAKTLQAIQTIQNSSSKDIGRISTRELWLLGIMLYWKQRHVHKPESEKKNENDFKKGVNYSSGDPQSLKFFLRWLKEIGKIENEEIVFDIFLPRTTKALRTLQKKVQEQNKVSSDREIAQAIHHWAKVTGFPSSAFFHIYWLSRKSNPQVSKGPNLPFGFLRIRVKSSSLLARQIVSWAESIQKAVL